MVHKMPKTIGIGIIGAGAAGVCAARRFLENGYSNVMVLEQNSEIGGTWIYQPETGIHSSLYEKMNTNLPKEVMFFDDFPFPDYDNSGISFIPHQNVLRYVREFANPVKDLIKFNQNVVRVDRINEKWMVSTIPTDNFSIENNENAQKYVFDVLFVCNGHNFDPRWPEFSKKYTKKAMHSHDYRNPKPFEGQTLAVVGAGPSGIDICLQIANVAKKVYIFHKNSKVSTYTFPSNVHELPRAVDATENSLILEDGHQIFDIDTIKYAMALIEGRAKIPKKEEFVIEHEKRMEELSSSGTSLKYYHYFGENMWAYFRKLSELSHLAYATPPVVEKIYSHVRQQRAKSISTYKSNNYKIIDDENFLFEYIGKDVYD